jgi:hypothetical protein
MSQEQKIQDEINQSADPIVKAYHKQMERTIKYAGLIGNSISHLRSVQNMTEDSITKKYIDGCIADIQQKFKSFLDE